jgi:uncharacterized protein YkwD
VPFRAALVCALALSVFAMSAAVAEGRGATESMLSKINKIRRAHGLRALHKSGSLTRSATRYSRRLMRTNYFGHASHIEASRRFGRLGEVLAIHSGRSAAVGWTVSSWMNSPEHRAILLSPSYSSVGFGRTYGRFRGHRANIWVGQLGHR